jgi:hypothetical protein
MSRARFVRKGKHILARFAGGFEPVGDMAARKDKNPNIRRQSLIHAACRRRLPWGKLRRCFLSFATMVAQFAACSIF